MQNISSRLPPTLENVVMIPSLVFIFCRLKRDLSFKDSEYRFVSESIWLQSNNMLWLLSSGEALEHLPKMRLQLLIISSRQPFPQLKLYKHYVLDAFNR